VSDSGVAWIRTVAPEEASGLLGRLYAQAVRRAGKVFNILRLQSLRPEVLDVSTALYVELMRAPRGGLSRARRELLATVVSRTNGCHY
jgi:alkylhydroperoxidase family enzyme